MMGSEVDVHDEKLQDEMIILSAALQIGMSGCYLERKTQDEETFLGHGKVCKHHEARNYTETISHSAS